MKKICALSMSAAIILSSCGRTQTSNLQQKPTDKQQATSQGSWRALNDDEINKLRVRILIDKESSIPQALEAAFAIYRLESLTGTQLIAKANEKDADFLKDLTRTEFEARKGNLSLSIGAPYVGLAVGAVLTGAIGHAHLQNKNRSKAGLAFGLVGGSVSFTAFLAVKQIHDQFEKQDKRKLTDRDEKTLLNEIKNPIEKDGLNDVALFLGFDREEARQFKDSYAKAAVLVYSKLAEEHELTYEIFREKVSESLSIVSLAKSFPTKQDAELYKLRVEFLEGVLKAVDAFNKISDEKPVGAIESIQVRIAFLRAYENGLKNMDPDKARKYSEEYKKAVAVVEERLAMLTEIEAIMLQNK